MYGRGWIKMGAGASFFFKNAGPVFKWFILLISISLNMFIEYSVMITRLKIARRTIVAKGNNFLARYCKFYISGFRTSYYGKFHIANLR